MFGSSTPFGQISSSPFGSQPAFGQTNGASSNLFTRNPSGSPNTFGSSTGGSVFGGTSTGVFGQPSTPAFGASSAATFGSPMPAFGASSAPAFGSSSSPFGGSSAFGQKPTFGGFGSTANQTSPFNTQQTQPAFGSSPFGSTSSFGTSASGATSASAFGSTSTPAFGTTTTPAFGVTSTSGFGAKTTPSFGSTSTSLFGNTGTAFGASSTPAFGSAAAPAFGASSSPAFGVSSTPTFGSSSAPGFGASTTPSFGFGATSSFGQSTSTFGSAPFGTTSSTFGSQAATSAFGSPGLGQSAFGGQRGGSRIVAYTPTSHSEGGSGTQPTGKLETISAMAAHEKKSHEELRWEDYQLGDKGGPNPSGQPHSGSSFPAPTQASPFSTSTFGQTAGNPFSSSTKPNSFSTSTFGQTAGNPFSSSTTPNSFSTSTFGQAAGNPFSSSTTANSFVPQNSTSASTGFASTLSSNFSSPFNTSSSSPFGSSATVLGSSSSIFGSSVPGSSSPFASGLNFPNTQSSGMFQSSAPSSGQTPSPFGPSSTGFQNGTLGFGSNPLGTPSTGFGGSLFNNSTPSSLPTGSPVGFSQTTPSLSTAFQPAVPAQTSSGPSFGIFGQAQTASSGGFGFTSNIFSQGNSAQSSAAMQSPTVIQPAILGNPFGTLPAVPQMSIGHVGSAPSIQYGISSMPIAEKSVPIRISVTSAPRHLSQRSIRLPMRYHPRSDGPRVPFFSHDEVPKTPKADAFLILRENPRALVIRPIEPLSSRTNREQWLGPKEATALANGNGKVSDEPSCSLSTGPIVKDPEGCPAGNGYIHQQSTAPPSPSKPFQKPNGVHADHAQEADPSHITITGRRAGEAATMYEHGADVEALMPRLCQCDYYTEPGIQELAAKERAESGFCCHVKDFVVGRRGYGCIKFDGETDVRRLDLDMIVQFNKCEVIVYKDESKKPPIGQGLNKPAEVTLLNVKYTNKKTGLQDTEGPNADKYKDRLMKLTQDQGAKFLSYDALKGEWKFKVQHFSSYGLGESLGSHAVL